MTTQAQIDQANVEFWNELCGSQLARSLGIADDSPESLKKFDEWYFGFYPYLDRHIPFDRFEGRRVLEVGLGYGTVAQRIAASGADYSGLDIAAGPVGMARHRLARLGVAGDVRQGSVLECPFPDDHFDHVVAIGCLHHTGDLGAAIEEVRRVLKPGGEARFMVYNAASYRQWVLHPVETLARVLRGGGASAPSGDRAMRRAYDANTGGEAAPTTQFVTKAELRALCSRFGSCRITRENIGAEGPLMLVPRPVAIRLFGPSLGLDLYCRAGK